MTVMIFKSWVNLKWFNVVNMFGNKFNQSHINQVSQKSREQEDDTLVCVFRWIYCISIAVFSEALPLGLLNYILLVEQLSLRRNQQMVC